MRGSSSSSSSRSSIRAFCTPTATINTMIVKLPGLLTLGLIPVFLLGMSTTFATLATAKPTISQCALGITGKAGGGVKHASFQCKGGAATVTIAVNEAYLGGFAKGFKGVKWDPNGCGLSAASCMMTFCGNSNAELQNVKLDNIKEDFLLREKGILCVGDSAELTFRGASFSKNVGTVLYVSGNGTVSLIGNSVVSGNAAKGTSVLSATQEATLNLIESHVVGNEADRVVSAFDSSKVLLDGTVVESNTVVEADGFAVLGAFGNAVLTVTGSNIVKNTGRGVTSHENSSLLLENSMVQHHALVGKKSRGAGLYAAGHKAVLSNVTVRNNSAELCAGLAASGGVMMTVKGGSKIENNKGGGMCVVDSSLAISEDSIVRFNFGAKMEGGAGLQARGKTHVDISNTTWLNNTSTSAGGAAMSLIGQITGTIVDSMFGNNTALYTVAGGLRVGGTADVVVRRCTFIQNMATTSLGGAGLAAAEHGRVLVDGCIFTWNKANYSSGGAISVREDARVEVVKSTFTNNIGQLFGGAIYVLDNGFVSIGCGSKFAENSANNTGDDVWAAADRNLVLGDANINIKSPSVFWGRRACLPGEFLEEGTQQWCERCQRSTFSVLPNSTKCSTCPNNANCTGGDIIIPDLNHWHSHSYSTQIHACPRDNICEAEGVCAAGYMGNVCGQCLPGYGSQGPFRCGPCMSLAKTLAVVFGGIVLLLMFIGGLVHTTLGDKQQSPTGGSVRPSDLIKLLVRHIQYLAIISTVRVHWPSTLGAVFAAANYMFNAASPQVVISLDCVFSAGTGPPLAIKRVLTYVLAPLGVFSLLILGWLVLRHFRVGERLSLKRREGRPVERLPGGYVLTVMCLVVLFFFYPALVRTSLSMFACYKLDDPDRTDVDNFPQFLEAAAPYGYWVHSIQQPCWQGWHLYWGLGLGVPLVLLLCFVVPVGMWCALYRTRWKRSITGHQSPLMFLYHNYKPNRWYWEVVSTVQVALLVAISVFSFTLGAYFTTLLLSVSVVVFWALQLFFAPFASQELHMLSLLSLGCLYATTSIGLTLFHGMGVTAPSTYANGIGIMGLVVNAVFVLGCIYRIAVHSTGMVSLFVHEMRTGMGWQEAGAAAAAGGGGGAESGLQHMSSEARNDSILAVQMSHVPR